MGKLYHIIIFIGISTRSVKIEASQMAFGHIQDTEQDRGRDEEALVEWMKS